MIWFACKQCGKVHSRPENVAGTMVFCACGQGTVVPWESTAAAGPVESPASAPPPLPPPRLDPVRFNAPPLPGSSHRPRPGSGRKRRRFRPETRDPNYCFNHEGKAKEAPCADCKEEFCRHCLVTFQERRLCAPCKNHRLRLAQRRPTNSTLAIFSVLIALGTGPLAMCLLPGSKIALGFVLAAELLALGLALAALWQTENNPKIGGQGLAWTGLLTALVAVMFNVLLAVATMRTTL